MLLDPFWGQISTGNPARDLFNQVDTRCIGHDQRQKVWRNYADSLVSYSVSEALTTYTSYYLSTDDSE